MSSYLDSLFLLSGGKKLAVTAQQNPQVPTSPPKPTLDESYLLNSALTEQLTSQQRTELLDRLNAISEEQLTYFCESIENEYRLKEYIENTVTYSDWSHIALKACLQKIITPEQLSTFCFYYEALKQTVYEPALCLVFSNPQHTQTYVHPLSSQENLNEQLLKQSQPTLHYLFDEQKAPETRRILQTYFQFSATGMQNFRTIMKKAPKSEQFFLTIRIPIGSSVTYSPMANTVTHVLDRWKEVEEKPHNEKISKLYGPQKMLIVPSLTMFQASLDLWYKENSFRLRPILGKISCNKVIQHKELFERVVGIEIPGIELPLCADDHYAGPWSFTLHDLYHATRYSAVKKNENRALLKIDTLFKNSIQNGHLSAKKVKDLKTIKWALIDGELHYSTLNPSELFGSIFHVSRTKLLWTEYSKKLVLTDMFRDRKRWKKEFGLSEDDLRPAERKTYAQIQREELGMMQDFIVTTSKTVRKNPLLSGSIALSAALLSFYFLTKSKRSVFSFA